MKIEFDDGSYVEFSKSTFPGKFIITIAAKDSSNPLKKIINAVEVDQNQFKSLLDGVSVTDANHSQKPLEEAVTAQETQESDSE